MSARNAWGALFLTAAALVGGCRKEEAPPQEDRTLAKLRNEVDRVNKGGPAATAPNTQQPEDPNARLAGLATGADDLEEHKLKLPEPNNTVHVDAVAVKLTGLEATHTVKGSGKMGLTSEDVFLRVALAAENVGQAPAKLDLGGATVQDGEGKPYSVARDAQVLAGTRQLAHAWETGERSDVVLVFEVPPSAVRGSALTLVLPASGGDVRLPLK